MSAIPSPSVFWPNAIVTAKRKSIGGGAAQLLAAAVETTWRLFTLKSEPPITRFTAAVMSHDCTIKSDMAERELQYTAIIAREQGLAELKLRAKTVPL